MRSKPARSASRTNAASRSRSSQTAASAQVDSRYHGISSGGATPVPGYVATDGSGATKTNTPLVRTPASVSVVTHDQIVDQNAQSVSQALRYTPGVVAEQRGINESSLEYLYSRGFQASTFLDGLPVPPPTQTGTGVGFNFLSRDPYFIDRVESIRGPLSVLYGQVPPGGFFNLVSKQPMDTPYHEVFVQTGSYGRAQGGFDFSGPLTDDKQWLYRLTGVGFETGTQTDFVRQERLAIAPSITWRSDLDTKLTISATYQNDPQAGAYTFVPAVGTVLPGPVKIGPSFNTGNPNFDQFHKEEASVGYSFEHRFDDFWQVKQNVRYMYDNIYIQNAADGATSTAGGTAIARVPYFNSGTLGAFTIDNQAVASFNTGFLKHEVVFGVDYQNYQYDHTFDETYTTAVTLTPLSLTTPVYAQTIPTPNFMLGTSGSQSSDQIGLYTQDQIGIGKLTVVGGVRQDFATSTTTSYKTNAVVDQTDRATTGRIGTIYNFDNGVAPYASYATSFQPQLGTFANGLPYLPTTGEQYEVGVKYQPVGTKNLFTIALFDLTQNNVLATNNGVVTQTGAVRSRGVEVEARTHITDQLQTIASYTYDDALNTNAGPTLIGKRPTGIPLNMASLWLLYDMPGNIAPGLKFGGGVRYLDSTWGDTTNTFRVPAVTLADLSVQYDFGQQFASLKGYTAQLSVSNLFNKDYIASCVGTAYCVYGQGRLVLANMKYRW